MKKLVLFGLLIAPISLIAMQEVVEQEDKSRWDADSYAQNSSPQEKAARQILAESGFNLSGFWVLDVGCGPGKTTVRMSYDADFVLGIDASSEMIKKSQQTYPHIDNVRFECLSAEKINVEKEFDIITSFFCLHWIDDKKTVFTNFYNALKPGGKMLCTVATKEEKPTVMGVVGELFSHLKQTYPFLQNKSVQELTGRFSIATDDLKMMLGLCGFTSIEIEPRIIEILFQSREKFVEWQRPIFMSIPMIKLIPVEDVENWFNNFIEALWSKLKKNEDGYTVYPLTTTRLTAQKPV